MISASRESDSSSTPSGTLTLSLSSAGPLDRSSDFYLGRLSLQDPGRRSSLERTLSNFLRNRHGQRDVAGEAGASMPTRRRSLRAHIPSPRELAAHARSFMKPRSKAQTLHSSQGPANSPPIHSQQQLDGASRSNRPVPGPRTSDALSLSIASPAFHSILGSLPNSSPCRPLTPPQQLS